MVVGKPVKRIICKPGNSVHWTWQEHVIHTYWRMCMCVYIAFLLNRQVGKNTTFITALDEQLLFPFLCWDRQGFCPDSWEQTGQGEEFLGGRSQTRLGTTQPSTWGELRKKTQQNPAFVDRYKEKNWQTKAIKHITDNICVHLQITCEQRNESCQRRAPHLHGPCCSLSCSIQSTEKQAGNGSPGVWP